MRGPTPSGVLPGLSERAFVSVIALITILMTTAAWRVFVAHADGRRAPKAGRQHGAKTVRHDAPRGILVDRSGHVLARSVLAYDVEIECYGNGDLPSELADEILACLEIDREPDPRERVAVRSAIELPPADRRKDLWKRADRKGTSRGPWQFYWMRRIVRELGSAESLRALEELGRKRYDGCRFRFRFESIWRRVYPLGRAASHVVGTVLTNDDGKEREIGLEAIAELDATASKRWRLLRNARGKAFMRELEVAPFADEFEPNRVVTTLDSRVQELAYESIERAVQISEAEWGLIFLVDLTNGDLIALAGEPAFDPEFRVKGDSDWPMTHWARVEPGSVIKPLLCALAVERGVVRPGDPFVCGDNGSKVWRIQPKFARWRRPFTDDHYIGPCRLEDILVQSSNIGAVKVGMRGGPDLHRELLSLFRLDEAPDLGLPLPRDRKGRVIAGSIPSAKQLASKAGYEVYTGPSLSFGYQLAVYPLSFARAFASMVTGRDFRIRLVRGRQGEPRRAGPGARILSESTVAWVNRTLARVITDPHGTARALSGPGIDGWLAGKTGTTVNRQRDVSYASFVGFAPVERPRWLSMAVLMKKNVTKFYGGQFAAPAVRDVLSYVRDRAPVARVFVPGRGDK